MKITSSQVTNADELYPGFVQGTYLDRDCLARVCGYYEFDFVCNVFLKYEDESFNYELKIDYSPLGEQKLLELDLSEIQSEQYSSNELEAAYSNARKNKVNSIRDVEVLADLFSKDIEIFRNNCWYEGLILLTAINKRTEEKEILINNQTESSLGLEGCFGSIQEIHDHYSDDDINIELIEYLLDYEN